MKEKDIPQTKIEHKQNGLGYTYPKVGMAIMPVDWANPTNAYRKMLASGQDLTIENQFQSSSCGGNLEYGATLTDFLLTGSIERKSRLFIYHNCFVPSGGSSFQGLGNVWKTKGVSPEALCYSYNAFGATDEQFYQNAKISPEALTEALKCRCEAFAEVNRFSIEAVAQAIRDEGFALIGYHGYNNGTMLSFYPQHPVVSFDKCWQHWVVAVDYGILNGRNYVKIANSWDKVIGDRGYQYFFEDYFTSGSVWCVGVFTDKVKLNIPPITAFHYKWTVTMRIGSTGSDVTELQRALKIEGFFPQDQVLTKYFGPITQIAAKAFQKKNGLVADGIVGPKTIAILNKKYL